jgi:ApeA N-terminal domain 1
LENWLQHRPFTREDRKEEEKWVRQWTHRFPDQLDANVSFLNCKIRTDYLLSSTSDHHFQESRHIAFFQIEPATLQDWGWFWKVHADLRNLLTFFVGKPVHVKHFTVHGQDYEIDGEKNSHEAAVYFKQSSDSLQEDTSFWDMLLLYPHIKNRIATILEAWFSKGERLQTVYDLFFGTFYNTKLYLRFQFLSLIHALESYDRIQNQSNYLSEAAYEAVRASLVSAIPTNTPNDLKMSLKNRIKYGNQYSLRKRLNNLMKSFEEATARLVADDSTAFVERIVETRNYFTHYTEELKVNAVIGGADLFYTTHRLRIFLTILLLKELGIEEYVIVQAIRSNRKLNFIYDLPFLATGNQGSVNETASPNENEEKKS